MSTLSSVAGGTAMAVVGGAIAGAAAAGVWNDINRPDSIPGMVTALGIPFGIGTGVGYACFGSYLLMPSLSRLPTGVAAVVGLGVPALLGAGAAVAAYKGVSHLLHD